MTVLSVDNEDDSRNIEFGYDLFEQYKGDYYYVH